MIVIIFAGLLVLALVVYLLRDELIPADWIAGLFRRPRHAPLPEESDFGPGSVHYYDKKSDLIALDAISSRFAGVAGILSDAVPRFDLSDRDWMAAHGITRIIDLGKQITPDGTMVYVIEAQTIFKTKGGINYMARVVLDEYVVALSKIPRREMERQELERQLAPFLYRDIDAERKGGTGAEDRPQEG